jgi:hypothetical protein
MASTYKGRHEWIHSKEGGQALLMMSSLDGRRRHRCADFLVERMNEHLHVFLSRKEVTLCHVEIRILSIFKINKNCNYLSSILIKLMRQTALPTVAAMFPSISCKFCSCNAQTCSHIHLSSTFLNIIHSTSLK